MAAMTNKDWLNTQQLMQEFGIALSTQAKYRREKKIPYSKIGGFVYYSRAKINEWIESHMFEAKGAVA